MTPDSTYTLNDANTLPVIGFGTYPMVGDEATQAVQNALDIGYRLIDTAEMYENEGAVAAALERVGLPRDAVKINTKISGGNYGAYETIEKVRQNLQRLRVDVIDMMLIHWPLPDTTFSDQWLGLIESKAMGLTRSIGVSNFDAEQLTHLFDISGVVPAVNQIEMHPLKPQTKLRQFHAEHGIVTQSWSPLGNERPAFHEEPIASAAKHHHVTPAQIVLRWHLQLGVLPLPKSSHVKRQKDNFDVFGFELSDDEMDAITALGDDS